MSVSVGKGVSVKIGVRVGKLVGNGFAGLHAKTNNATTENVKIFLLNFDDLARNPMNIVCPFQGLMILCQPLCHQQKYRCRPRISRTA